MSAVVTAAPATQELDALATETRALAARLERDDLAERLDEVRRRAARTDTIVCVVGEFKKGKSALINALLGTTACPVDDDLATTAVTVVRYGETPSAVVHRRVEGEPVLEPIEPTAVPDWTLEGSGRDGRPDVDLVEVRLPSPILESGLTLVDTPGVGGLNAGHAAATLAFLPSADALVFVTDASAELSGPELEFLASARGAGPPVLVAVTKIDMYPEWRRIVDIDVGHLQAIGLAERPFALSSVLRSRPDERDDESGYGAFTEALLGDVMERARSASLATAVADVRWVLGQLREPLVAERAALEHPETADRIATELATTRDRLATLQRADAMWSTRLDDEFTALRTTVAFEFQREMRGLVREVHAEIETTDPGGSWSELNTRIQDEIATAVRGAFRRATTGAAEVQATIAAVLADQEIGRRRDVAAGDGLRRRGVLDGRPGVRGRDEVAARRRVRGGDRGEGRRRPARARGDVARGGDRRAGGARRGRDLRRQGGPRRAPPAADRPPAAGPGVRDRAGRGDPLPGRGPADQGA